jgi:hypothetical protein
MTICRLCNIEFNVLYGSVDSNADLKPKGLGFESRIRQGFFCWNLSSSDDNETEQLFKGLCLYLLSDGKQISSERNTQLIIGTMAANADSGFISIGPGLQGCNFPN